MSFLSSIVALFRKGTTGFSSLELVLLHAIERELEGELADRLRRRIKSINLVQRLDGGREVNAYCINQGKPSFDESLRLTNELGERRLASFSFIGADSQRCKGAAWLVNGQLFSIEFDNPTKNILESAPSQVEVFIHI